MRVAGSCSTPGPGIRRLGNMLGDAPLRGSILLTHLHWDHTQGLPFVPQADRDDAEVDLYLPRQPHDDVSSVLALAMSPPHFPIGPDGLQGDWTFSSLDTGTHIVEGFEVTAAEVADKGGRTFGYRIADDDVSIVYLPDHAPAAPATPSQRRTRSSWPERRPAAPRRAVPRVRARHRRRLRPRHHRRRRRVRGGAGGGRRARAHPSRARHAPTTRSSRSSAPSRAPTSPRSQSGARATSCSSPPAVDNTKELKRRAHRVVRHHPVVDPVRGGHRPTRPSSSRASPTTTRRRPTSSVTSTPCATPTGSVRQPPVGVDRDETTADRRPGYTGGGVMGSTTVRPRRAPRRRSRRWRSPTSGPSRRSATAGPGSVQTVGGRTGLPAPRRVNQAAVRAVPAPAGVDDARAHDPRRRHAPSTSWSARARSPVTGCTTADGKLAAKAGLADFKDWYRHAFGKHTPVGRRGLAGAGHRGRDGARAELSTHDHAGGRQAEDPQARSRATLLAEQGFAGRRAVPRARRRGLGRGRRRAAGRARPGRHPRRAGHPRGGAEDIDPAGPDEGPHRGRRPVDRSIAPHWRS